MHRTKVVRLTALEADEEASLWVKGMFRIKISDTYQPEEDLDDTIAELSIDEVDPPILVEEKN